jgi:hypothetical protein
MSSNAGGVLASRVAVALTSLRGLRESEFFLRCAQKSYPQVYPQVWIKVGDNHLSVVAPFRLVTLRAGRPYFLGCARVNPYDTEQAREVLPVEYLRLVHEVERVAVLGGLSGRASKRCVHVGGHCLAFLSVCLADIDKYPRQSAPCQVIVIHSLWITD